jgi:hypothetical protein
MSDEKCPKPESLCDAVILDLRRQLAAAHKALRDIAATAGHPDAAEACRLIIGIVKTNLEAGK